MLLLIAYCVLSVGYGLLLGMSARMKLARDERAVEIIGRTVGAPLWWFPWLALAEISGAIGLLVGIALAPIGLAAAIGLLLYFVAATLSHIRVRDYANLQPALIMLSLSVAALVLRAAA